MQATLERLRQRREDEGNEGGFTLIELLIVVVILGILAAIVVFAVQNLSGQSAKAACGSDYKTTESASELYKAQIGSYPTSVSQLTAAAQGFGPWLKDTPINGTHYAIADNNGTITVDTVNTSGQDSSIPIGTPGSTSYGTCAAVS